MSVLEGPLNVLGQRTTGESVRTQNGEVNYLLEWNVFRCVLDRRTFVDAARPAPWCSTSDTCDILP